MYRFNKRWMDKVARLHPEGIVHTGLSDHESLSFVPVELIGTLHYLQSARIMKEFAGIMKDQESKSKYNQTNKIKRLGNYRSIKPASFHRANTFT